MCSLPYLGIECKGGGGCLPRCRYATCFCSFFALGNSKIEVYETYFCLIVTTCAHLLEQA